MAALHDAGLDRPGRFSTLAQLGQWAEDHEKSDDRQFSSIDRKLNWLIGAIFAAAMAVAGTLANDKVHEQEVRLMALERPAAAVAVAP
jgi:hypothetical protein